jgi:hypothetical protein
VETVGQIRDALPIETPDLPRRAAILRGTRD